MKLFKKLAQAAYKSSKPAHEQPTAPLAHPLATVSVTSAEPLPPEEAKAIQAEREAKQKTARSKLEQEYQELLAENERLKEKNTLLLQLVCAPIVIRWKIFECS